MEDDKQYEIPVPCRSIKKKKKSTFHLLRRSGKKFKRKPQFVYELPQVNSQYICLKELSICIDFFIN